MSSQLLNQQLWITGGEAALQEVFHVFPSHNSFIFSSCAARPRGEARLIIHARATLLLIHTIRTRAGQLPPYAILRVCVCVCACVYVCICVCVCVCVCVWRERGVLPASGSSVIDCLSEWQDVSSSLSFSLSLTHTHTHTHTHTLSHCRHPCPVLNMHHCCIF